MVGIASTLEFFFFLPACDVDEDDDGKDDDDDDDGCPLAVAFLTLSVDFRTAVLEEIDCLGGSWRRDRVFVGNGAPLTICVLVFFEASDGGTAPRERRPELSSSLLLLLLTLPPFWMPFLLSCGWCGS